MDTEFGILRGIAAHEHALMREWRNAPAVRRNMYTQHEISAEEHEQWWSAMLGRSDNQYFMYEYHGKPSGIVAFTNIDNISSNSTWAFYAAEDAPKGTGSRMEFLALEYAFTKLNLHKLCCEVLAYNSPVIKLHQKFGFKIEGIFRNQHFIDNSYVDVYRLGILASEWAQGRELILQKLVMLNRSK
ncbi:UDP-4-amino-4,6-dideoxy-N-acetyl-beta-L-altrosamine N-acetyltransferase [Pseudomonas segetis]|uniref:UDP-4-amino-4,6-dideoxy-N-acetyl-beta-L-altrosamine N-acetyltransferase n=1 Tax=Pseudomonas segetis TaxID=298908 RepID=A0A239A4V6_9PSED|nr:UDP-4-amino-4,6-dideoxy-N-acetyl-beta-L-altrosamine N-acetyltransferase [Pseudomonas segetis]SNR90665.1 UDP-4-amino-4,6-dideoxy-N-acetyl-beta-L-altrosamine N-acetyltransferase [Pseudomonas segetis]